MFSCLAGIALQRKQRAEKPSRAGMHRARQMSGCAQRRTRGFPGPAQPPSPPAAAPLLGPGRWQAKPGHPAELVMEGSYFSQKPSQAGVFPAGSAGSYAQKQQFLPLHMGPRASPTLPLPA